MCKYSHQNCFIKYLPSLYDGGILGCCAVQSFGCIPAFRRNMLPPHEFWGSHGDEDVDVGLLGGNTVGLVGKYQNPEDRDSMFLRNVDIYLHVHPALQPRRSTSTYCLYLQGWRAKRPHSAATQQITTICNSHRRENVKSCTLNIFFSLSLWYQVSYSKERVHL
jgi:hypothetical protein